MEVLALSDKRTSKFSEPLRAAACESVILTPDDTDHFIVAPLNLMSEAIRRLHSSEPDVVVANYAGVVGLIAVVLGRLFDVPSVIRLGGDPITGHRERRAEFWRRGHYAAVLKYTLLVILARIVFRYASGFIVVSNDLKDRIAPQLSCSRNRVGVVRPSIDIGRFEKAQREPDPTSVESSLRVLTVTNFEFAGKLDGVRDSLAAMRPLLQDDERVEYVVAGDGIYREEAVSYADRLFPDENIRRRIEFPGFVGDVESLYCEADLFLYVSYVDGYPNVVQEAQASGLPVVANPSYGVGEQIEDGETGVLVDPGDVTEITDAVRSLLDHPDERTRIGRAARTQIRANGTPDIIGQELCTQLRAITGSQE